MNNPRDFMNRSKDFMNSSRSSQTNKPTQVPKYIYIYMCVIRCFHFLTWWFEMIWDMKSNLIHDVQKKNTSISFLWSPSDPYIYPIPRRHTSSPQVPLGRTAGDLADFSLGSVHCIHCLCHPQDMWRLFENLIIYNWLVVWNIFYFPNIIIIPID